MNQSREMTLNDVVGYDIQKAQLRALMQVFKDPSAPHYVLVTSPPGIARTMVIKLAVREAGASVFRIQISNDMMISDVERLLRQAAACEGPVAIIVDSIDRGHNVVAKIKRLLDRLLSERQDVLVIATTIRGEPVPSDFQNLPTIEFEYMTVDDTNELLRNVTVWRS